MALPLARVRQYAKEHDADPSKRLKHSIMSRTFLDDAVTDSEAAVQRYFKHQLEPSTLPVADQYHSGRCWIFCFTNMLRRKMIKRYGMNKDFCFSQKYVYFFDRLEKCNALLEVLYFVMGKGAGEAHNSLYVTQLREAYLTDGGTWDFFVNVVEKYGIVSYETFPDNAQTWNTKDLNKLLKQLIVVHIKHIGSLARAANRQEFDDLKSKIIQQCYNLLETMLGTPPAKVQWQFPKKNGTLHVTKGDISPLEYYTKYVKPSVDVSKFVTLINDPRKPYYKMYTVELLHNVLPELNINKLPLNKHPSAHYFNVPLIVFKESILKSIKSNIAVPFASDIHQYARTKESRLDIDVHYEDILGIRAIHPRKSLYENLASAPNHAMLIIATNGTQGEWQVENSWGKEHEKYPYITMTEDWLNHFVGEIIVHKKMLPTNLLSMYERLRGRSPADYHYYSFWDVFGTLASSAASLGGSRRRK